MLDSCKVNTSRRPPSADLGVGYGLATGYGLGLEAALAWLQERGVAANRQHELSLRRLLLDHLADIPQVTPFCKDTPDQQAVGAGRKEVPAKQRMRVEPGQEGAQGAARREQREPRTLDDGPSGNEQDPLLHCDLILPATSTVPFNPRPR